MTELEGADSPLCQDAPSNTTLDEAAAVSFRVCAPVSTVAAQALLALVNASAKLEGAPGVGAVSWQASQLQGWQASSAGQWVEIVPAQAQAWPAPRAFHTLTALAAWDEAPAQLVLFGGWTGHEVLSDVWLFRPGACAVWARSRPLCHDVVRLRLGHAYGAGTWTVVRSPTRGRYLQCSLNLFPLQVRWRAHAGGLPNG